MELLFLFRGSRTLYKYLSAITLEKKSLVLRDSQLYFLKSVDRLNLAGTVLVLLSGCEY